MPILAVRVKPGARKDAILGWEGGELVVAVSAPPVDGRANEALLRLLAAELGVAPGRLSVRRGGRGRNKHVEVPEGVDLERFTRAP